MLILPRQAGQTIIMGDDITITVQKIRGNQVSISVSAPKSVCIDKEEVRERKKRLPETTLASHRAY
jgi:carbon storage regulator